jgi:hypothetical protein
MPYNNTSICIEGLLSSVELGKDTGKPSLFYVFVNNINFFGKPFSPKHENSD